MAVPQVVNSNPGKTPLEQPNRMSGGQLPPSLDEKQTALRKQLIDAYSASIPDGVAKKADMIKELTAALDSGDFSRNLGARSRLDAGYEFKAMLQARLRELQRTNPKAAQAFLNSLKNDGYNFGMPELIKSAPTAGASVGGSFNHGTVGTNPTATGSEGKTYAEIMRDPELVAELKTLYEVRDVIEQFANGKLLEKRMIATATLIKRASDDQAFLKALGAKGKAVITQFDFGNAQLNDSLAKLKAAIQASEVADAASKAVLDSYLQAIDRLESGQPNVTDELPPSDKA
jgi:hypothetical protein